MGKRFFLIGIQFLCVGGAVLFFQGCGGTGGGNGEPKVSPLTQNSFDQTGLTDFSAVITLPDQMTAKAMGDSPRGNISLGRPFICKANGIPLTVEKTTEVGKYRAFGRVSSASEYRVRCEGENGEMLVEGFAPEGSTQNVPVNIETTAEALLFQETNARNVDTAAFSEFKRMVRRENIEKIVEAILKLISTEEALAGIEKRLLQPSFVREMDAVASELPPAGPLGLKRGKGVRIPDQTLIARDRGDRVAICHVPGGNKERAHTLFIPKSAVEAHLAHGDLLGACPREDLEPGEPLGPTEPGFEPGFPGGIPMPIPVPLPFPASGGIDLGSVPPNIGSGIVSILPAPLPYFHFQEGGFSLKLVQGFKNGAGEYVFSMMLAFDGQGNQSLTGMSVSGEGINPNISFSGVEGILDFPSQVEGLKGFSLMKLINFGIKGQPRRFVVTWSENHLMDHRVILHTSEGAIKILIPEHAFVDALFIH